MIENAMQISLLQCRICAMRILAVQIFVNAVQIFCSADFVTAVHCRLLQYSFLQQFYHCSQICVVMQKQCRFVQVAVIVLFLMCFVQVVLVSILFWRFFKLLQVGLKAVDAD